jgi:hypothetical protein
MHLRTKLYESIIPDSPLFSYNKNNIFLCIIFTLALLCIFTIVALIAEYFQIENKIKNKVKRIYKKNINEYEYKFIYEYRETSFPYIVYKKVSRRIPKRNPISIKVDYM